MFIRSLRICYNTCMKSIDSDISNGKIKNIYLLMGVEPYLIYRYRDKLVHALVGKEDEINYKRYSGDTPDINAVIEYADTVPFFADRKVIVLEDTGVFKSQDDRLAAYLEELPETTYMIFVECFKGERFDERRYDKALVDKRYKLFKTVQKLGRVIEFKRTDEAVLVKWLLKKFSDSGLAITRRAMDTLLEYVGDDMTRLDNEAEKLICYRLSHKSVDEDDVKEICVKNIDNDIFEMVSSIAVKNRRKALKLYYDLIALKESPMKILALIGREFNLMLKVKGIKAAGGSKDEIVKTCGISPYFVGRYVSVSSRFTHEYLKEAVKDCVEMETLFKQGRVSDVIGVEMLLIKYAS